MTVSTTQGELDRLVQLVLQGAEANARPDLVRRMRIAAGLVATAQPGEAAAVAATVVAALESLEIDLRARRAALCDPGRGSRLAAEARYADTRLRRFQEHSAKWQRMLSDALSALDSDLEWGVQNRMRALLDEGTGAIETLKPGTDLQAWLRPRLIAEAEACHQDLRSAAAKAAGRLVGTLELTDPVPKVPVRVDLTPPEELLARLHPGPRALSEKPPLSTRLLGIIMPTYSGMMIALVLPRLIGLEPPVWVIGAVALTGSVVMGGAAFAGERQRQRSRRNAENAGELRSTVDAFRMALGKQIRDAIRAVDQQLHTGLGDAVTAQTRRLTAAADAARQAADDSERTEQGCTEIDQDLESVRELRRAAQQLAAY